MAHFRRLLTWTSQILLDMGFQAQFLPDLLAQRQGKAELNLESRFWRHPLGSEAKCAYLSGPRAEIVNLMIYPRNAQQVPVFAVELILYGQIPRVAVVDLQAVAGVESALAGQVVEALLEKGAPFRQRLSAGGELPPWALPHFTSAAIYSRPQTLAELAPLLGGYRLYLKTWRDQFFPHESNQASCHLEMVHYQKHHVENTPGRRFLHTSFGESWSEQYLSEFMYCQGLRDGLQ